MTPSPEDLLRTSHYIAAALTALGLLALLVRRSLSVVLMAPAFLWISGLLILAEGSVRFGDPEAVVAAGVGLIVGLANIGASTALLLSLRQRRLPEDIEARSRGER